ncbi:MAG TPA: hypothetical protein VH741_07915 [Candidatus Limnocylindrales bacterium]
MSGTDTVTRPSSLVTVRVGIDGVTVGVAVAVAVAVGVGVD